jgi:hypothetical protein
MLLQWLIAELVGGSSLNSFHCDCPARRCPYLNQNECCCHSETPCLNGCDSDKSHQWFPIRNVRTGQFLDSGFFSSLRRLLRDYVVATKVRETDAPAAQRLALAAAGRVQTGIFELAPIARAAGQHTRSADVPAVLSGGHRILYGWVATQYSAHHLSRCQHTAGTDCRTIGIF